MTSNRIFIKVSKQKINLVITIMVYTRFPDTTLFSNLPTEILFLNLQLLFKLFILLLFINIIIFEHIQLGGSGAVYNCNPKFPLPSLLFLNLSNLIRLILILKYKIISQKPFSRQGSPIKQTVQWEKIIMKSM